MQVKVNDNREQYGTSPAPMPPDLRMIASDSTRSIGHHDAHDIDDRIVEGNHEAIADGTASRRA